jgi:CRP/FNR family transcriptional regulator, cyclic AMP receptor protein
MVRRIKSSKPPRTIAASATIEKPWLRSSSMTEVSRNQSIFQQGEPCGEIFYLHAGTAKIHMLSSSGREAVIMVIGPGEFFGEGALLDQAQRIATVTALTECTVERIEVAEAWQLLRDDSVFAKKLMDFLVTRNRRYLTDLSDHHFHTTEQRLARALLQLPRVDGGTAKRPKTPRISQEMLAEMIGTTRSRVNFFMNKFRDLGMIEYNNRPDGDFIVHASLARFLERG